MFEQLSLIQSPWFWTAAGFAAAVVVFLMFVLLDRKTDNLQRAINKIENQLTRMGAFWLAEFLEDMVVGDERAIVGKTREIIEAVNTEKALVEKIGRPIALWTADFAKRNDPALFDELKKSIT